MSSTNYLDIRPQDRGVEIGRTWTTPSLWGGGINREPKYLLLVHVFDAGAIRVAIKTNARNERSRRGIERLGMTYEGTWRNHRILSDGHHRDSAYYGVIDSDWPQIHERLGDAVAAAAALSAPRHYS